MLELAKLRIVRNIEWTNKTKIRHFLKSNYGFPNWKKNSKNFQFGKLSYILSVRKIQTDVNIRNIFLKKSNNSTFVISIFEVSNFRNIGRCTFGRSKFWHPPGEALYEIPYNSAYNELLHVTQLFFELQIYIRKYLQNCVV